MRPRENYTPFVAVALALTLAIMASFQIYIFREPTRIAADEAHDKSQAVDEGRTLFGTYCNTCHGKQGEGVDGPPLNDKRFLTDTNDQTIFSLISSGVPGSEMPAWNQSLGGPLTHQQVSQLVAFIRHWEAEAPDRQALAMKGDPVKRLTIFSGTCTVCHGENGQGSDRAPALKDPAKLAQFDDAWYVETISSGRPAKGMPTWGTVLSPVQIRDLVGLLRAWERGETVNLPGPAAEVAEALHLLAYGDLHGAEHALEKAASGATGEVLAGINQALAAIEAGDQAAATAALQQVMDRLGVKSEEHMESGDDEHMAEHGNEHMESGKDEHLEEGGEHTQSKDDEQSQERDKPVENDHNEQAPEEGSAPMAGDHDGP